MNVMEFYPSKFCLITDVLDTFGKRMSIVIETIALVPGKLVYTRLLEKSASSTGKIRKSLPYKLRRNDKWHRSSRTSGA
jgi:hypothetical protein